MEGDHAGDLVEVDVGVQQLVVVVVDDSRPVTRSKHVHVLRRLEGGEGDGLTVNTKWSYLVKHYLF